MSRSLSPDRDRHVTPPKRGNPQCRTLTQLARLKAPAGRAARRLSVGDALGGSVASGEVERDQPATASKALVQSQARHVQPGHWKMDDSRNLAAMVGYRMANAEPTVTSPSQTLGETGFRALDALAALGQQTRLAIFRFLMSHEPCGRTVGEIAVALGCPQNTTSGHLSILARAGLVKSTRQGRSVIYRPDLSGMRWLLEYLLSDCCNGDPAKCAEAFSVLCSGECEEAGSR